MNLKILYLMILLLFSCEKSQEQSKDLPSESELSGKMSQATMSADDNVPAPKAEENLRELKAENELGKIFTPLNTNLDRLIEYNIDLSYESTDLINTRKQLLSFVSKYGFLESSSAENIRSPYMSLKIRVSADKLYESLQELDKLGNLLSENISTIDHTEGMVWQKRKITRERLRQIRRGLASRQVSTNSKNWQEIEESVSSSEDQLDLAEQESWKINDRVKWATITLSYRTPVPPDAIQVPAYKNAFIGLLNLFLELTYYLIWILPFIAILGGLFYLAKKGFNQFRKSL